MIFNMKLDMSVLSDSNQASKHTCMQTVPGTEAHVTLAQAT